jgi:hypothetical protein
LTEFIGLNSLNVAKHDIQTENIVVRTAHVVDEPDYTLLMNKMNKECFETDTVNEKNRDLFVIDNCLIFPENILIIKSNVYYEFSTQIFYVYGSNV